MALCYFCYFDCFYDCCVVNLVLVIAYNNNKFEFRNVTKATGKAQKYKLNLLEIMDKYLQRFF